MITYAMKLFKCFIFKKFAKMLKPCFLFCRCGEWSVDWGGGKSNLRQQHNKM